MFKVSVESTLKQDFQNAMLAVGGGIRKGVRLGIAEAVVHAKTQHRYKDRTGDLTRSIQGRMTTFDLFGAEGELEATAPYAKFVEEGTKPHEIWPKRSNKRQMLAWEEPQGDWHYARMVHHPGTPSLPFMGPALLKFERVCYREIDLGIMRAQRALDHGGGSP